MALRNAIAALLGAIVLGTILAVTGCNTDSAWDGGLGADSADAMTTTIVAGSVGDGPIVGARVRVFTKDGQLLPGTQTLSGSTADYTITIRTQGRNYPLTIVADGGIDLVTGGPPDFSLVSVIMGPGNNEIANLNPYSTLIVRAAQKSPGGISSATIAAATDAVVERYGFGLGSTLVAHPIFSPMDNTNVHVVVKASETLGETIRRTRDAMSTALGTQLHGDAVVEALAADLVDGWIDGRGATGHSRRFAAVANVASAPVMLEALANRLYVYGGPATEAMDEAIIDVRRDATLTTADVTIPPEALLQARRALHAAMLVTSDSHVPEALYAVQTTLPGSTHLNRLPSGDPRALGSAIAALNTATLDTAYITDTIRLDTINRAASSETVPYVENPIEPAPSDENSDPAPEAIVTVPDEGEEEEEAKEEFTPPPGSGGPAAEENQDADGGANEDGPIVEDEPANYEPNAAPVIFGMPTTALVVQRAWSFTPEAHDPDGDTLTFSIDVLPGWAQFDTKTGRIWGTPMQSGSYGPITITVSDPMDSGTSLEPFTLQVDDPALGAVRITWAAPTEREDGTKLEDLAGYRIYYGRDPDALTHAINIEDASQSSQLVENLGTGIWHFAVSAYDSKWLESAKSSFAKKTVN